MKESYGEGLASHTGPESCVGRRKAAGEALTGVHADQPLNSEIKPSGTPTPFSEAEGNIAWDDSRESQASPAESKTLYYFLSDCASQYAESVFWHPYK